MFAMAELYTLIFGLGIITMLWYSPKARFEVMAVGCTLAILASAHKRLGEAAVIFGVPVPGGTMELCLAASMVGLIAAKMGTETARRICSYITMTLLVILIYEMTRVLAGDGRGSGYAPPSVSTMRDAMFVLTGFYLYTSLYLTIRRFTQHLKWKRLARWAVGVIPGTMVLFPIALMAYMYENQTAVCAMAWDWQSWAMRTFVHATFVGAIMLQRWWAPSQLVVDN